MLPLSSADAWAASPFAVPSVPRAGEVFAGFTLLEEIATGGMGVVFRARRGADGPVVAIKMILPFRLRTPGLLERFLIESRAAAKLDHPNILPVLEVGEERGLPWFTMPFAEGGSTAARLPEIVGDPRRAARIVLDAARAAHHAHERGILHRDLKPGNLLLDGEGRAIVADFGLAKVAESALAELALTQTNAMLGTPHYASPEQIHGEAALTPASDVYSLGAILFELVSGRPPFAGVTMFTALRQASEDAAPPLRSVAPAAPEALETICGRCLQPDPALRYRSAAALADDLESFLANRPLGSHVRPLWPRVRRWARRRRTLAGVAGAALLVGAGLAAGWFWQRGGVQTDIDLAGTSSGEAQYFLRRAITLNPSTNSASRGSLQAVAEVLGRAIAADPQYAAAHAELSRVHSQMFWHYHDRTEARARLAEESAQTALRLKPDYPRALLAQAEYLFRVRRDDEAAMRYLERARRRAPRDPNVLSLIQLVAKRQGRWEEAIAAARQLCRLRPDSSADFFYLGLTLDLVRRYDEAVEAFDRAIYLSPEQVELRLVRGWSIFRGRGDLKPLREVVAGLSAAERSSEQWMPPVLEVLRLTRQFDEGERLIQLLPDDFVLRDKTLIFPKSLLRALALATRGDAAGAAPFFAQARAELGARRLRPPDEARVHASLALALAGCNEREAARREAARAVEMMPTRLEPVFGPDIQLMQAEVLLRIGDAEEGVALLTDLLGRPGELTMHDLRLNPRWDFARELPAFQRLLAGAPGKL